MIILLDKTLVKFCVNCNILFIDKTQFFFCLFRAAPIAYGGSQVRG